MIASALRSTASLTILLKASSRAWIVIWVYDFISPPIMVLNPAIISLPICRARMVFPFTTPRICFTFFPGISAVVVVIIFAIILLFSFWFIYIFSFFDFIFFFVEYDKGETDCSIDSKCEP
jgi:hypothetical protein